MDLLTILYELKGETLYVTDIIFNEEFSHFILHFLAMFTRKYCGIPHYRTYFPKPRRPSVSIP